MYAGYLSGTVKCHWSGGKGCFGDGPPGARGPGGGWAVTDGAAEAGGPQQLGIPRPRRPRPDDPAVVSAALPAWQEQSGGPQLPDHAVNRFYPQEGGEDELDPLAHLLVGVLDSPASHVTNQADGQAQDEFPPPGLV